ncbi:hypothetical protein Ancab_027365 [Ancistrocladus abbreviatus]
MLDEHARLRCDRSQQSCSPCSCNLAASSFCKQHPEATATHSCSASSPSLSKNVSLWAFPSNVPRNTAQIADWLICAIVCQVTCPPVIVACLLICALNSNRALLVAVVAQPYVTQWHWRSCTVLSLVTSLSTSVTDALIRAVASFVARLLTVPTK